MEMTTNRISEFFRKLAGSINLWMRYILMAVFLAGFLGCIFVWHRYVKNPEWSEEKKRAYADSKGKDVYFDEGRFKEAIERAKDRENEYQKSISVSQDIFRIAK